MVPICGAPPPAATICCLSGFIKDVLIGVDFDCATNSKLVTIFFVDSPLVLNDEESCSFESLSIDCIAKLRSSFVIELGEICVFGCNCVLIPTGVDVTICVDLAAAGVVAFVALTIGRVRGRPTRNVLKKEALVKKKYWLTTNIFHQKGNM